MSETSLLLRPTCTSTYFRSNSHRWLLTLLPVLLGCLSVVHAKPDELFVLFKVTSYEYEPGYLGLPDQYGFRYTRYNGYTPEGTSLSSETYNAALTDGYAISTDADIQNFVSWADGKLLFPDNYLIYDDDHGPSTWLRMNGFKIKGAPYQIIYGPQSSDVVNYYEVVPLNTPEPPKLTIKFLAHPAKYTRLDVSDAALITLKLTSTANPASAEYRFLNADDILDPYPREWQPLTQRTANEWELRLPILPLGVTKIEARARGEDGTLSAIATTSVTYTMPPLVRGPAVKSVLKPVFDGSRNPAPVLNATALTGSTTFDVFWTQLLGGEYAIDSREPGRALWVAQGLVPQGEAAFTMGIQSFWRVKGALSSSFLKALGSGVPAEAGEVYMTDMWLDTPNVQQDGSFLLNYKFSLMVRPTTAAGAALAAVPLTLVVKYGAVRTGQHYLPFDDAVYTDAQYPRTLPEPASVTGAWIIRNDTQHELAPSWTVPGANSGTAQDRLRAAFSGLAHFGDGSVAKASAYAVKPIGSASVAGLLWSGLRETYYLAGDDFSHRYREARWADSDLIKQATVAFSFSLWGVVDKSDPLSFAAVVASTPGTKAPAGADVTPPTLALTAPKKGLRVAPGGSTPLQGTAKDNAGVTRLEWRWDSESTWHNVPFTAAAKVDFNTPITAPAAGLRALQARAYDAAGNRSVTVVVPVTIADSDVTIALTIEGQGKVTGLKAGANMVPGALPRTVSATAAAGWSFSHWSVGGVKTSEETPWIFTPGAGTAQISAVFAHQGFAELAGTYRGLDMTGGGPVGLNFTVAANGACTGSYKEDGIVTRFVKTFPTSRELSVAVRSNSSLKTIILYFALPADLSPGDDPGLSGGVMYMDGLNYLGSFNLMRSEAGRHADYGSMAGLYQGALSISSPSGHYTGPTGWLRTVIASNGNVTTTGKLPSCEPLAMSGPLWRSGNGAYRHVFLPLLQTLPSGAGSFDLLLDIDDTSDPAFVSISGNDGRWWHRRYLPATASSNTDEPVEANLSRYVPPGKNEPLFTSTTQVLALDSYYPGDEYGYSYTGAFTLNSRYQASIEGNPKGWKLAFNAAAGTFTGTFVEARGGAVRPFTGIFQWYEDGSGSGIGLYLHPTLGPCPVRLDVY